MNEFAQAFKEVVAFMRQATEYLLLARDERLRAYGDWTRDLYDAATSDGFLERLGDRWAVLDSRFPDAGPALLLKETRVFVASAARLQPADWSATSGSSSPSAGGTSSGGWWRDFVLDALKILLDSIKDMFQNLPPGARILVKALQEAAEILKSATRP